MAFAPALTASADAAGPSRDSALQVARAFDSADVAQENFDPSAGLSAYQSWASRHSPVLRAAFYDWMSALERTAHVGAPPDPRLLFGYYIESVETRVGPQNFRLAVQQSFPWFGTLGAQKDAASSAAEAAYRRFQATALRLHYEVTAAYGEYYFAGRELEITRDNLELLGYWERVARARYRVSLAPHPDVIKAQVELGQLEDRVLTLQSRLGPAATRLRVALNLPDTVDLPLPTHIAIVEDTLPAETVTSAAMADNPGLQAALAAIDEARAHERVAARQGLPSFTFGLEYISTGPAINPAMEGSGKDPWIASAGLSLPIWLGQNGARRREAEARRQRATYAYLDLRRQLEDLAVRSAFEHDDALRKVRLYRDGLIPKAEQSLGAAHSAYEGGEASFLDMLDAQRQLLDFQLRYERAKATLATRRAEIEMLTGSSIPDLYPANAGPAGTESEGSE